VASTLGERLPVHEAFDDVLENGEDRDERSVGQGGSQNREGQRPAGSAAFSLSCVFLSLLVMARNRPLRHE
jgi:hypothetical protein